MSMVDTEVCRSLVEQMLLPGCTYDVTDKIQMKCVADFYEMKENTTGVTGEILVKEFETRVKMIQMNMRTPSSFERLRHYLGQFQTVVTDTRVKISGKKMVSYLIEGVAPLRLQQRLWALMNAGSDIQKSARYDAKRFKTLLRLEVKKEEEAIKILK